MKQKLIPRYKTGSAGVLQEGNKLYVKKVPLSEVLSVNLNDRNIYLEELGKAIPMKEAFEKYPNALVYMDINTGELAKNSDMGKYGYYEVEDIKNSNTINDYIKIPLNILNHLVQSYTNRTKTVKGHLKNGEFGKAGYSHLGYGIDELTVPITSLLMKVAPSYATPIKDIIITGINRLGRSLFNDPKYTAVYGHTYFNDDLSMDVNSVAKEHLSFTIDNPKGD